MTTVDAQKQQILGFFIEEAREHLDTIERGLLSLKDVVNDQEQMNELFRAAHSVKGGAAMLGYHSIQQVAHRLEDCFKVLKEEPKIQVDQVAEDLFLRGFDTLQQLLEQLQGPYGLQEDEAEQTVKDAEPVFVQLHDHLNQITGGGAAAMPPNFAPQVMGILKEMLVLFKQPPSDRGRQQIQGFCDRMAALAPDVETWEALTQTAKGAVGNPNAPFKELAPLLIKELKQASELMAAGKGQSVHASAALQKLATVPRVEAPAKAPVAATPAPPAAVPPVAATPAPPVAVPPVAASPAPESNELVIPRDPRGAAQALVKAFDRKQLTELAQLLIKVIKGQ
ncbi:Hpt domain-containing protein [Prochlorothrix hollandica]|uniref:Histidine kinase n=1 Tax=Prochlorothrix hollandica PCC 9006 = CALU 1027 TaxID=317619 RepID=A0A0M2PTX0_PROHO|nr:Hpt domain-containing protein [Prochlorothrix hollandica]KKI98123.1 histidine kinase [Prochlorothrix hollandica PCC 9006 = CALU 1027]